jgi:pilus assembly protein CpaE
MKEKLKTLVVFDDERFRKECRHQLGKLEDAKIVQEISYPTSDVTPETWDEIVNLDPQVLIVELSRSAEEFLSILQLLRENLSGIPVLLAGESFGSEFLIEAMRLGVIEVVPKPLHQESLHEAMGRIRRLSSELKEAKSPANILSFFSSKGGSGCTTIVSNFAVSLSKLSKKKVLVLDLDFELGEAASFFGLKNNRFLIQEGTENTILDSNRIARTITTHSKSGIDLLSFSDGFPKKAKELAGEVRPLLALLQREYDFILVDASSSLNELVVPALDSSHLLFLISKCSLPALRNTQRVLYGFERLGYSANRIRVLLNRYCKGEDVSVKEVEKTLGFKVFWSIPNDYKSLIRSIQCGDPLTLQESGSPLAKSFHELSAEVLGIKIQAHPRSPGTSLLVRAKDVANANKSLPLTTLNLLKN